MPALTFFFAVPFAAACKLVGPNPSLIFGDDAGFVFSAQDATFNVDAFDAVDGQKEIFELAERLKINGIVTGPSLNLSSFDDWTFFDLDTFELTAEGWNFGEISSCGMSTDRFLGGHCRLGSNNTISRQWDKLPSHSLVKITGRVHFFDQWQGESVFITIDGGMPIWTESWHWCDKVLTSDCIKKGLDVCGRSTPDRLSTLVDISLPHSADSLTLSFGSTISSDRSSCDISYGIDDIGIWFK